MAPTQNSPNLPSSEHKVALKETSSYHLGLTPPDTPTMGLASVQATVKDLKHLLGVVFEKVLLDSTNREPPSTPVSQDRSTSGLDMVQLKQLLVKLTLDECASAELSLATKPARPCSASNKQEVVQVADGLDLDSPICTTPDDFKSFETWASTHQFKTVVETYEPPAPLPIPFRNWLTWV
jgi:hypothetical protein